MPTKATLRQTKYYKYHTTKYTLKLNTTTDKDVIDKIENTAKQLNISKQGAIKHLIKKSED